MLNCEDFALTAVLIKHYSRPTKLDSYRGQSVTEICGLSKLACAGDRNRMDGLGYTWPHLGAKRSEKVSDNAVSLLPVLTFTH